MTGVLSSSILFIYLKQSSLHVCSDCFPSISTLHSSGSTKTTYPGNNQPGFGLELIRLFEELDWEPCKLCFSLRWRCTAGCLRIVRYLVDSLHSPKRAGDVPSGPEEQRAGDRTFEVNEFHQKFSGPAFVHHCKLVFWLVQVWLHFRL